MSLFHIILLQILPLVPRLYVPAVACPSCSYPNDKVFRFCQRCGYKRRTLSEDSAQGPRLVVNWGEIQKRKGILAERSSSTPYSKQKSSLEKELSLFLAQYQPPKDIVGSSPDDIINFLIWKDGSGKTKVHTDECPNFGNKKETSCSCPTRLAYTTVDTLIGKLRSIFNRLGRQQDEATLPGYGNPAADISVKKYLSSIREEQLRARILPSQAQPLFLRDLAVISNQVLRNLKRVANTKSQTYIYARDQAFFKVQFFAGDRGGDLGRTKSKELLFSQDKDVMIFNHTITKSMREGSTNMFALKRYKDPGLCPIVALEVYARICDHLGIPIRQGYLFRPTSRSGEVSSLPWDSSAAQARLSFYTKELEIFRGRRVTLHGLRSGCAISLALSGADMNTIMGHVGWKTEATANHYVKLQRVLSTKGAAEMLSQLPDNLPDSYNELNSMHGFVQAL